MTLKMNRLKDIITLFTFFMLTCTLWAQNEVSLVVSGEGKDKEDATFKALRSAIEQAYGTFVSANTTVLNDQLVADEIVSLSSGNIQKYEYVSENKMPNGNTFVTLSATVSIDKLVSFAESKGMEAELKGSLFAMNIKKMEFDKKAEEKAIENLCKQIEAMLSSLFDYEIILEEPKKSEWSEALDYQVDYKIIVSPTKNILSFYDIMINSLDIIGLNDDEIKKYKSVNMNYYSCYKEQHDLRGFLLFTMGYIEQGFCHYLNTNFGPFDKPNDTGNYSYGWHKLKDISSAPLPLAGNITGVFYRGYITDLHYDLFLRSDKSVQLLFSLYNKFLCHLYNFTIIDNVNEYELFMDSVKNYDRYDVRCRAASLPFWFVQKSFNSYSSDFYIHDRNIYNYFLNAKNTRDIRIENKYWSLLIDIQDDNYYCELLEPKCEDYHEYCSHECKGLTLVKGSLFYSDNDIQKITHISVGKPTSTNDFSNNPAMQESHDNNQVNGEDIHQQSKLHHFNDTLQQVVDDYNALVKQYPYDYNENHISYSLSSGLYNDEFLLRDTLHSLLRIISDKKAQLVERYKKDSIEFKQMSQSLQDKIDEANKQLLNYPYNLQKRTLRDSLSLSFFGKQVELKRELQNKVSALPAKQKQVEKEVYENTKKNQPPRFTEIWFSQNPQQKHLADSAHIECRCQYSSRTSFYMAWIDKIVPQCDCREKKFQEIKSLYHSREEFDQSYNKEESVFEQEVANRKKMWQEIRQLEDKLLSMKQVNMKKALSSSKPDVTDVISKVSAHRYSFYYTEAIDLIFKYDEKLTKEWGKNGSYFESQAEMYEIWIGEEYDKVLKARKKE